MCVGSETKMSEVENSNYGDQSSNNIRDEVYRRRKEGKSGVGEGLLSCRSDPDRLRDGLDQNDTLKEKWSA